MMIQSEIDKISFDSDVNRFYCHSRLYHFRLDHLWEVAVMT